MKETCVLDPGGMDAKEIMPFSTPRIKRQETQKQRKSKAEVHRMKNEKKILPIKDGVL